MPIKTRPLPASDGPASDGAAAVPQPRESLLAEAQALARLGSWEFDLVARRLTWSDEVFRIFELDPAAAAPSYEMFLATLHPDDRARVDAAYRASVAARTPYDLQHRLRMPDGRIKHVAERGRTVYAADGTPLRSIGIVQDVTERVAAERLLRLYARVFESSVQGALVTDETRTILAVNRAFTRITGYEAEEVVGNNPRMLSSGRHGPGFYREMWRAITLLGGWEGEIWNRRKNGEVFPQWLSISTVRDEAGHVTNFVATFSDLTRVKSFEQELERLKYRDALTGLPNRMLFLAELKGLAAAAERDGHRLALFLVRLHDLKDINDGLEYATGDEVLKATAARLVRLTGSADRVARLGGNKFALAIDGFRHLAPAARMAQEICALLARPFVIAGHELAVSVNVGISVFPDDGGCEGLVRNATVAMRRAKAAGRNTHSFYTPQMTVESFDYLVVTAQIKRALTEGGFVPHYQPQVDLATGRLAGFEALARWEHPEHGLMPPGRFIPVAEESGLIVPLGAQILEQACAQGRRWLDRGAGFGRIAVNVSCRQFEQGDFAVQVLETLEKTGLPPQHLELEITEGAMTRNPELAARVVERLRAAGVTFALDDFGTGYSSLGHLKMFPIDKIKLDRTFVATLPTGGVDVAIIRAVIALARSMELACLAEGVETETQRAFLQGEGCRLAQGYLFGKPAAAAVVETGFL